MLWQCRHELSAMRWMGRLEQTWLCRGGAMKRTRLTRGQSSSVTNHLNPAVEEAGVKALDASGASLHLRDWPLLLLTPTAMSMAL